MRLKIFSCHHLQPETTCNTEIFQSLVSNVQEPPDRSFMSDLSGINIADNNLYSELRHQYFVWKNLLKDYDYIGFEHYRRPFFIDTLPMVDLAAQFPAVWGLRLYFASNRAAALLPDPTVVAQYWDMRRSLDQEAMNEVKRVIGGYDIIVPRPNLENIKHQWEKYFADETLWNTMVESVNENSYFKTHPRLVFFEAHVCYFANMYIMRRDLLDEYLTFCFEALDFCRSRLTLRGRALGYFSERLFSFWFQQKRVETPSLRVLELPLLMQKPAGYNSRDPHNAAAPEV